MNVATAAAIAVVGMLGSSTRHELRYAPFLHNELIYYHII